MIRALRVQNLAVIDELDLELSPGLNVFTGETGAGKSVLLSAVSLLTGRRASSEIVRTGADAARVESIWDLPQLAARADELGLTTSEDELLIARSVPAEGRGKVYVNGKLATAAVLADLVEDSIEIISQGAHLKLLQPESQANLLDEFGSLRPLVKEVTEHFESFVKLSKEIHQRHVQASELARREDHLRFEVEQIDEVDPRPDELEALEAEHGRLAHMDRLVRESDEMLAELDADGSVVERAQRLLRRAEQLAEVDPAWISIRQTLERGHLELLEARESVERYISSLEVEPDRFQQVENRLAEISKLQRRYGTDVESILKYRDDAKAELENIGGGEARTAELESQRLQLADALDAAASKLSRARHEVAKDLVLGVNRELGALDLKRAEFRVQFDAISGKTADGEAAPSAARGRERPVFELIANPGEEPRRLRDAASGGELARLLLALRNVLRDSGGRRVLIFDEVDAGISGATAAKVGERLRRLARHHQVLCITHLPQIAALAEEHFRVAKKVRKGRTETTVVRLEPDARVDEIARMASAGQITDVAREHARELLSR